MSIQLALKYGKYLLHSKTQHGVHSPFVYSLLSAVIENEYSFYVFDTLSQIRKELSRSDKTLEIQDFGAGSKKFKGNKRKVKDIAAHGISKEKYAQLLFRLVNHFNPEHVAELGTSIGLTTLYLASAHSKTKVYTIEGSAELAEFAKELFNQKGYKNIESIIGTFDTEFPQLLARLDKLDFLYVDGNHQKDPTVNYFKMALEKIHNDSVIIFDDIHWSEGMEEAWEEIRNHSKVTLSLDLFQFGIVFFRNEHKVKEHFTLRY